MARPEDDRQRSLDEVFANSVPVESVPVEEVFGRAGDSFFGSDLKTPSDIQGKTLPADRLLRLEVLDERYTQAAREGRYDDADAYYQAIQFNRTPEETRERQRLALGVGASLVAAFATGGQSLWIQALAQGGAAAASSLAASATVDPTPDPLTQAAYDAAIVGTLDAATLGVFKGLGGTAKLGRELFRRGGEGRRVLGRELAVGLRGGAPARTQYLQDLKVTRLERSRDTLRRAQGAEGEVADLGYGQTAAARQELADRQAQAFIKQLEVRAGSRTASEEALGDIIEGSAIAHKQAVDAGYAAARELSRDTTISSKGILGIIDSNVDQSGKIIGDEIRRSAGYKNLRRSLKSMNQMSVDEARRAMDVMGEAAAKSARGGDRSIGRVFARTRAEISDYIMTRLPDEARAAWGSANELYASGADGFRSRLMQQLAKDPDGAMGRIIKNRVSVKGVRELREEVMRAENGQELWDSIGSQYAVELLLDAKETLRGGPINAQKVLQKLSKNKDQAVAILGREQFDQISSVTRELFDAAKQYQDISRAIAVQERGIQRAREIASRAGRDAQFTQVEFGTVAGLGVIDYALSTALGLPIPAGAISTGGVLWQGKRLVRNMRTVRDILRDATKSTPPVPYEAVIKRIGAALAGAGAAAGNDLLQNGQRSNMIEAADEGRLPLMPL